MKVVIEMKNGVEISGIIEECDSNMNLTIHDVRQVSLKGDVKNMDVAFVNGSSILYVHLPPGNIRKHVKDHVSSTPDCLIFYTFGMFVILTIVCSRVHYVFCRVPVIFLQNIRENYRRKKARSGNKSKK